MLSVFQTCTPRPEVLKGELTDDIFAARLRDVLEGSADKVYQDPTRFFENTFPTDGLRTLLREALGRLTGAHPTSNPVLRLETAFGGGKSHNLIALYHVATGRVPPHQMEGIISSAYLPAPGAIDIAGVVGSDLQPSDGLAHADGTRTYTLWGEIAYQLGRRAGYALAKQSDQQRTAPGTGLFEELIGNRPTLIMIDEIARHMRTAQGIPTATGKSDLAAQTVAFLMSLFEFAASRSNVVVVFTLAGPGDAFADETDHLRRRLAEASGVAARQEMVIRPSQETELSAIVTHRLFAHIDRAAAGEVQRRYADAYRRWHEQGVLLPQSALRAEYAEQIRQDYPFHPELLTVLSRKVSTIPNFQKTRGALRLLALVIRRLWEEKPANTWLIHPYHIDLAQPQIANDLTSRLQRPAFQQVIEADIVSAQPGSPAHAQEMDESWTAAGKPPYARRTAATVFLHSLTQGIATGVDPADLRLAVLQPDDDPLLVDRALERLDESCWFFEWDGHRYRFKTEPSLNKIVTDEMGMVGKTQPKKELDERIRQVWREGAFKPVFFPQEAGDVDDDAQKPKLVVLHYDAESVQTGAAVQPPLLALKIALQSGALNAFRAYRNQLVFLVADRDLIDNMIEVAQRYLAIKRIVGNPERLSEFNEEQRKKLKKMGESAELEVRVAITRTYRHLYYPQAEAGQEQGNLAYELLPAQDQGEIEKNQTEVVLRALKLQKKVLTGDDSPLAAAYVKARAWNHNQVEMSTEDLRKAYARRLNLPILLDINQLKKTIANGIQTGTWVYYDAGSGLAYDADSPPPAIQISDEIKLYLPEEAARLKLPIKGKVQPGGNGDPGPQPEATCPVCGNPISRCTCGDDIPGPAKAPLRGEGPPQQAFQQLLDACQDRRLTRLGALRLQQDGTGKDGADNLRILGAVVSQLGATDVRIALRYNAEFGEAQSLSMTVALDDKLYKRLRQVTDALAKEADKFHMSITVTARYESGLALDGNAFQTLHDLCVTIGLGRIRLDAEPLPAGEPA